MAEPVELHFSVQFAFRGYSAWALAAYSERQQWKGNSKVVEWIVEQWLEANQYRLKVYGLSEVEFAIKTKAPQTPEA